jgi:hypothetical protein
MNGIHDLGGKHGMGPIAIEKNEPYFHEEWEGRMMGMMVACFGAGVYNVDQFRHPIEKMDPAHYLISSYYEHWLCTVEDNCIEKGIVTREEVDALHQKLMKEKVS